MDNGEWCARRRNGKSNGSIVEFMGVESKREVFDSTKQVMIGSTSERITSLSKAQK